MTTRLSFGTPSLITLARVQQLRLHLVAACGSNPREKTGTGRVWQTQGRTVGLVDRPWPQDAGVRDAIGDWEACRSEKAEVRASEFGIWDLGSGCASHPGTSPLEIFSRLRQGRQWTLGLSHWFSSSFSPYMNKVSKRPLLSPKHVNLTTPKLPQDLERNETFIELPVYLSTTTSRLVWNECQKKKNLKSCPGLNYRISNGLVCEREDPGWEVEVRENGFCGWILGGVSVNGQTRCVCSAIILYPLRAPILIIKQDFLVSIWICIAPSKVFLRRGKSRAHWWRFVDRVLWAKESYRDAL